MDILIKNLMICGFGEREEKKEGKHLGFWYSLWMELKYCAEKLDLGELSEILQTTLNSFQVWGREEQEPTLMPS